MALYGNLDGLSKHQLSLLEELDNTRFSKQAWADADALDMLWLAAKAINKELAVTVDRSGRVLGVTVAHKETPAFYTIPTTKRNKGYAGVRFIRTQLKGDGSLSNADRQALRHWQYDGMLLIGEDAGVPFATLAILQTDGLRIGDAIEVTGPFPLTELAERDFRTDILAREKDLRHQPYFEPTDKDERAVLVFLLEKDDPSETIVKELKALAETAGIDVVGDIHQIKRGRKTQLGEGKLQELMALIQAERADVVVFDAALSPSANRELEDACGVKVIDKTALILDIFAQRARSREGKLQVELAQLNYLLPRLTGKGVALSRLGGGVGTRGPGETQLESDRRHIRRRLDMVRRQLKDVMTDRETQRATRIASPDKRFALVGYTNAGKSSLLNLLSKDTLYAEDQLFATLDPTTRRVLLPSGKRILVSDTVGFIRDLPPQLLDAFKATLEELKSADVLLHVVDVSQPGESERIEVVEQILDELELAHKPMIYVFNKIDLLEALPVIPLPQPARETVYVSTENGQGMASMWSVLEQYAGSGMQSHRVFIPFAADQGRLLAMAHAEGHVTELQYEETGVAFQVSADQRAPLWHALGAFFVAEDN